MGGCCCSAKKDHLHGTTTYYYYPPALEDDEAFATHDGPIPTITSGLLVNTNTEALILDNFRAPPAPIPYDVVLRSQLTESVSRDPLAAGHKSKSVHLVISPKKLEELSKSDEVDISVDTDEENVCPICLEEYDKENPSLVTKCDHDFHLSCILEWMERSDICPICDKVLALGHSFD